MYGPPSPATLMQDLLPRLTLRARRLTGDPAQAEDLAQDAALHLWGQMARGAQIDNPEAYAMTSLRHAAFRRRAGQPATAPLDDVQLAGRAELPARLALADVQRAIRALPDDQAALMTLVFQGVTSPSELAHHIGAPEGTVMSRLARARARLRAELGLRPTDSVALLC